MISKEERFETFLKNARLKHGNKFDYSLVEYKNSQSKVKIICPIHGIFEVTPNQHLNYDCGKCWGYHKTTEDIIKQFKEVHGERYDYSLVEYKNDSSKVKIICPTHGVFNQQVACHLRSKQGCPQCGNNRAAEVNSLGQDKFIERIEKIYGKEAFDYSLLKYQGAHTPVSLICKKCGNIETKAPSVWYRNFGCLICDGGKIGRKSMTQKMFLDRVKEIHKDKYDYSETNFEGLKSKVKIICPIHGVFEQRASDHIEGCGCPTCRTSKGEERIIRFLKENNINYIFQHQVRINNSYHYYDFYLEDYNLMIEFNGMQHYKPIKFFGGEEGFELLKKRDEIKKQYCLENQIDLFILSYKENIEKKLLKKLNVL